MGEIAAAGRPLRLFEVTIADYEPRLVQAKTASEARYDRFLAWSEVWDIAFRDFLKITKVRTLPMPPRAPRHPAMTDDLRELARHALGLPNDLPRSYRNRFVTGPGGDGHAWDRLVTAGLAKKRSGETLPFGGSDFYWLTREGAVSALEPGETLCPEDFQEPRP